MIQLQDVPHGYAYCFADSTTCSKASTCLHAVAANLLAESPNAQPSTLHTINPLYVRNLTGASACEHYRSSEPVRYARGMKRIFDDIPLKQAHVIRLRVMDCFSCESFFYRSRRGTRLITPSEQQAIARVFRAAGLSTAPTFDSYENGYIW
ncbi:MAG: DUF6078 family protein [Bacteroides sp.]|nr:DUF6078 family protein [Bacteroides sp.]